jgi:hypothetical protein
MPFHLRRGDAHDVYTDAKSALERIKLRAHDAAHEAVQHTGDSHKHTMVDVSIQFIGANGVPKMDVVGSADPYFIATIDDRIKFMCVAVLAEHVRELMRAVDADRRCSRIR